ncbi:hypothetical protein Tco_0051517 [Tanacetum coccineum]
MESLFSNSDERDLQQLQERLTKTRKDFSVYFELVNKHSKYLQTIRWNGLGAEEGFNRAIQRYFGDNRVTFKKKLSYNIDNLQWQIEKEYLHEGESRKCFIVLKTQFETFFISEQVESLDHKDQVKDQVSKESFQKYTGKELQTYRSELIYYMNALEMNIDRRLLHKKGMVNEGIALDAGLDSKASTYNNTSTEQQDESSSSGYVANAKRVWVDKTAQTFLMLLLKEDNVNTGKKGLGFEKKNDVENPFVMNKAKELTPILYNINEMRKESLFDQKIISEEELYVKMENFASQVDVKKDLSKPTTPHYWPNIRDPAFAKPHHLIASSESRNSSKNMPIFRHRFSPKKISVVYVKTTPPRSSMARKPTGRIFTSVGLRWIPTGKTVATCLNANDSAIPLGKKTSSPKTVIFVNYSSLRIGTSTASEPISL